MGNQKKPFIIGIVGGSGSGKSYFLNKIKEKTEDLDLTYIAQDNYYKPIEQQLVDENGVENFDLLSSIDDQKLEKDIDTLIAGGSFEQEEYTFNKIPDGGPKVYTIKSSPVIIVEGLFVFAFPHIRQKLDLKVYVHSRATQQMCRRIARDSIERGYDLDDVLYRYRNHITPAYDKFIEPHKETADIVVNNNINCEVAAEIIAGYIRSKGI